MSAPISLLDVPESDLQQQGVVLSTAGWGSDDRQSNTKKTDQPFEIQGQVVEDYVFKRHGHMYLRFQRDQRPASGDSGGPLWRKGAGGGSQDVLVGIVRGPAGEDGIQEFTRVSTYRDWIADITGLEFSDHTHDCTGNYQDCQRTKCCKTAGTKCYKKNEQYAQ